MAVRVGGIMCGIEVHHTQANALQYAKRCCHTSGLHEVALLSVESLIIEHSRSAFLLSPLKQCYTLLRTTVTTE